jgi:hypothetical protein
MKQSFKVPNANADFLGIGNITPLDVECLPQVRLRKFG